MTTREFRRYSMKPEMFDAFAAWYLSGIPAIRAKYGFTVEFVVIDREHLQFDWVVSHPGTEEDFRAAEAICDASPEFLEHRKKISSSLTAREVSFVEVVVPQPTV